MPGNQPPPAKITRPRLHKSYPRARLFSELDSARESPCIWISGPPGAGKTTLMVSYLEAHHSASLWYQVDEGDADIANFFYYLGLAAKKATRRRKNLPLLTPEYAGGVPVFTRRFFEQLFGWLKLPFIMVLDNYQTAGAGSPLDEIIAIAVEVLPPGGNLIVLSREPPPPAFARLRTHQRLAVIDWDKLQLDTRETRSIVQLYSGVPPTTKDLQRLEAATEGWAAGLVLLLQSKAILEATATIARETPQVVFDYFAEEILKCESVDVQDCLMKTALVPKSTAEMAGQLTGNTQAGAYLANVHSRGYFTAKHKKHFQFHPMFRAFLLRRLAETHSPADTDELKVTAAELLQQDGDLEPAVDLLIEANAWTEAGRLICEAAPSMLDQGRYQTLEGWIRALPDSSRNDQPWLTYWFGACSALFEPRTARRHFESAYRKFRESGDDAGILLAWSGVVDTYINEWDVFASLDPWLDEGQRLLESHAQLLNSDIGARFLSSLCSGLTFRRPDRKFLPRLAKRVQGLIVNSDDPTFKFMASLNLSMYYVWTGRVATYKSLARELRLHPRKELSPAHQILGSFYDVISAWMYADLAHASRAVDTSLDLAEKTGVHGVASLILGLGVQISLIAGDLVQAGKYLRALQPQIPRDCELYRGFFLWLDSWLDWLSGDLNAALAKMLDAQTAAHRAGVPYPMAQNHITLAMLLIHKGEFGEAQHQIDAAYETGHSIGSAYLQYQAHFTEATLGLYRQDDDLCRTALHKAFSLAARKQLFLTDMWHRGDARRLCTFALTHDIETSHVRELIRRSRLTPDPEKATPHNWPWPVKVYVLGDFRLLCDDQPVTVGSKGKKKVLELLKVLIASGRENLNMADICEAIWPDSEADAAHSTLKSNVHRLRKLLGHPEALQMSGGTLSLNPAVCWTDVAAFERLTRQINGDGAEASAPKQLLAMYRGPLLPTDGHPDWVVAPRDRLHQRFLRAVERSGQQREGKKDWGEAIKIYEAGLEVDPIAESLYRSLMRCHKILGETSAILSKFERCKNNLAAGLGIEPSRETRKMAQDIAKS